MEIVIETDMILLMAVAGIILVDLYFVSFMRKPPAVRRFTKKLKQKNAKNERVEKLAKKMNVEWVENVCFEGGVPTHINGQPIPERFLSSIERDQVKLARWHEEKFGNQKRALPGM